MNQTWKTMKITSMNCHVFSLGRCPRSKSTPSVTSSTIISLGLLALRQFFPRETSPNEPWIHSIWTIHPKVVTQWSMDWCRRDRIWFITRAYSMKSVRETGRNLIDMSFYTRCMVEVSANSNVSTSMTLNHSLSTTKTKWEAAKVSEVTKIKHKEPQSDNTRVSGIRGALPWFFPKEGKVRGYQTQRRETKRNWRLQPNSLQKGDAALSGNLGKPDAQESFFYSKQVQC